MAWSGVLEMTQKTRSAPPRAAAMLESLRGLGYSTAAALADIIDNSISAGAAEVKIEFVAGFRRGNLPLKRWTVMKTKATKIG